jgi:hypothetical protein
MAFLMGKKWLIKKQACCSKEGIPCQLPLFLLCSSLTPHFAILVQVLIKVQVYRLYNVVTLFLLALSLVAVMGLLYYL